MIYKALREKTKDIFQWGVVAEDVYDKKKNIWRKDWPVYGAFYRGLVLWILVSKCVLCV